MYKLATTNGKYWGKYCYSSSVFSVLAQGGCIITPVIPTTLTAAGGVLANGTENVMIQCNCTDDDGTVVEPMRWHDPDGTRLLISSHRKYVAGTPYYRKEPDNKNIVLVIPMFTDSYDGMYICGIKGLRPGVPSATVNLSIGGK